jgi:hypothetical protein
MGITPMLGFVLRWRLLAATTFVVLHFLFVMTGFQGVTVQTRFAICFLA